MASHGLESAELRTITPEALVEMKGNELVDVWKKSLGIDIWNEIGQAYLKVKGNKKVSDLDKFEAAVKVGELALRIKRAGASDKSGSKTVNIITPELTAHLSTREQRG